MNSPQDALLLQEDGTGPVRWRSVGAIAAGLAARIEAQRTGAARPAEAEFLPVAWAAE